MLVGVWAPKRWDLSLAALTQYTVPKVPPESEWIDKPRSGSSTPRAASPVTPGTATAAGTGEASNEGAAAKPKKNKKDRRPPSRRLVRHVLRARLEASKALAGLFTHLERAPDDKRVRASSHLARAYGGTVDPDVPTLSPTGETVGGTQEPRGWRAAKEVVTFLQDRGAKIAQLRARVPGQWAAVSSEGEGTDVDSGVDDLVFVPSSSSLNRLRKST